MSPSPPSTSLSVTEPIEAAATGMALARLDMMMASPETRRAVQHCRQDQYVNCDSYSKYRMSDGSCNNLQVSVTLQMAFDRDVLHVRTETVQQTEA